MIERFTNKKKRKNKKYRKVKIFTSDIIYNYLNIVKNILNFKIKM